MIDLSPGRNVRDLLDALNQTLYEGRRDLRPQVEELLGHPEELVRMDAVSLLTTEWRIKEHRATVREMMLTDASSLVRLHAVLGLGWITDKETRKDDAELLARVYNNREERADVRTAAFGRLRRMAGRTQGWLTALDDTDTRQVEALLQEIAQFE